MDRYHHLRSDSMGPKSCTSLCHCGGFQVEVAPKQALVGRATSGTTVPMCKKLDELGGWLIDNVIAAFFGSLQRCSCIHIDTKDEPDHDPIYMPLGNANHEDANSIEIPIVTGM